MAKTDTAITKRSDPPNDNGHCLEEVLRYMNGLETSLAQIITSPGFNNPDPEPKKGFAAIGAKFSSTPKPDYGNRFFSDELAALRTGDNPLPWFKVIPLIDGQENERAIDLNKRIVAVNSKIEAASALLERICEQSADLYQRGQS